MAGEPWEIGQRAARALRSELGLGEAPIDIRDVIRRRGVQLVVGDFEQGWGDGRYLKKGDRYLIVLNATIGDAYRSRFTGAHELGHHELHRDNQEIVVHIDTNVYSKASPKEREADAFAAYLLVPDEALKRDLKDVNPAQLTPDETVQLMIRYGVSHRTLVYRLHNSGMIGASTRNRLLAQGAGRIEELKKLYGPREDDVFFERPQLPASFRSAALKLYENRHIELGRLAELLRTTVDKTRAEVQRLGVEREPGLAHDEAAVEELLALADRDES